MKYFDKVPLPFFAVFAIFLAIAPIYPQPHLLEKLQMLINGALTRPIDIFDLFWHSFGLILLALKVMRMQKLSKKA